jgi:hypothetical protein
VSFAASTAAPAGEQQSLLRLKAADRTLDERLSKGSAMAQSVDFSPASTGLTFCQIG